MKDIKYDEEIIEKITTKIRPCDILGYVKENFNDYCKFFMQEHKEDGKVKLYAIYFYPQNKSMDLKVIK